jgi:hypothetical protein
LTRPRRLCFQCVPVLGRKLKDDRFDAVRSRAERIRVTGTGTPETKPIGRNTLLLQMINPAPTSNALKSSVSSPADEVAAVRADGRLGRVSDNVATIAAS